MSIVPSPSGGGAGGEGLVDWNTPHAQRFKAAMDDDFNTPEAMAVLFDLTKEVNRTKSLQLATQLKALGGVLGLLQSDPDNFLQEIIAFTSNVTEGSDVMTSTVSVSHTPESIGLLIVARATAKQTKNFAEADRIRKELLEAGIVLEDSATGTTWRRA